MAAAELRAKKYMKETAWMKYLRLEELKRHRWRCQHMQHSIDNLPPPISLHQLTNKRRADLQEVLGGASNWIGTYKKGYKNLCDVRPWRKITGIVPDDPAPFSTLKLEPRAEKQGGKRVGKGNVGTGKNQDCGGRKKDCKPCEKSVWTINCGSKTLTLSPDLPEYVIDKLRVIEKNLLEHKHRKQWIQDHYSMLPRKTKYLVRGQAPYKRPKRPRTIDEKLESIRKWAMKHHIRQQPNPPKTGFLAFIASIFSKPPVEEVEQLSLSSVTEEEAKKDPQLALLKEVQEAGDPHF